jgi:glycine/D-amino acid oxidase-like deaminating enzyme/nitrite reductase/ring-hydroxylating ferredoxin subunit
LLSLQWNKVVTQRLGINGANETPTFRFVPDDYIKIRVAQGRNEIMSKPIETPTGRHEDEPAQTLSVWMDTGAIPLETPLTERVNADVCIVGAGIAGMTTAYLLAREGKSVVVLDDGPIGGGMTGRTTAHLVNALDDRYFELERLHGEEGARLAAESHTAAIDKVEQIVDEEKIACEFERLDGYLFVPPRAAKKILDDELAAAHRAGLLDIEKVERVPWDSFDTGPALRFPRQAQFHPLKYLAGLAKAIKQKGGRIYTESHAKEIEGGRKARVETNGGGVVNAEAVVIATNSPVNDLIAIHTKQAGYQTFVIGARIPRGSVKRGLYWDTPDPYHYIRIETVGKGAAAYDVLIVGGEDHKTGQKDDAGKRFGALERWTRHRFPMIESIDYRWSGEVMEPIDGLAFIGRNPMDSKNVFIATGDSGNGMTHGTIAGMLLTEMILGRKNDWESIYDPSRITLKALGEFAKENLNVAAQYKDLIFGADVDSESEIKAGSGAVILRGLHKVAVYRDTDGATHERSAVCRHLGCIVNWNTLENTWDCPCHGSRYDALGHVVQGPANSDLPPVEDE